MFYNFPIINNIDDVLPHIKDFDEILVADGNGFTWIDYVVDTGETFSRKHAGWEMRRECRGLLFDYSGNIISRPFHKVFNVNQLEETQEKNIDWNDVLFVEEKLDGSMIRSFLLENTVHWATRKGITDTTIGVKKYAQENTNYTDFSFEVCKKGITPIFEWVGPSNHHVVEYDVDSLTLLMCRENVSGIYLPVRS